jgi:hypothetical protein
MAGWNVPNYTTNNVSIGPGILYLAASGTTPTVDVGAVKGGELTITREKLAVEQGFPAQEIISYAIKETVTLTVQAIEWNFEHLAKALGAGVATATQFDFGGDINFTQAAVRFTHRIPAGATITIDMWRCDGAGDMTTSFAGQDVHEFPYSFNALNATTDWASNALDDDKTLFQMRRQN